MTDEKTTIANVRENGQSDYAATIEVSGYQLIGDEPANAGGGGVGPSPYDLLTAALAECTVMTVRWYALQQKWPLEKIEATVSHHKEGKQDIFQKQITLHGAQLTDIQKQKLTEIAGKCPVQRTLEGTPSITTI